MARSSFFLGFLDRNFTYPCSAFGTFMPLLVFKRSDTKNKVCLFFVWEEHQQGQKFFLPFFCVLLWATSCTGTGGNRHAHSYGIA